MSMHRPVRSAPKQVVTVAEAREVLANYRGDGFIDSTGRICGDYTPNRVIDAAERYGDDVTLETVRWRLRVGIA